jgi:hypothetical protein
MLFAIGAALFGFGIVALVLLARMRVRRRKRRLVIGSWLLLLAGLVVFVLGFVL